MTQTAEVFKYLDRLQASSLTNMFGAPAYLERNFLIPQNEAFRLWSLWIDSYDPDISPEDRAAKYE